MIIYNVFLNNRFGRYYQGSFSTREKAEKYVNSSTKHYVDILSISEHTLDSEQPYKE